MRRHLAVVIALAACHPARPEAASLMAPAAEIEQADLDPSEVKLVVPEEDLAAHPGPRPRAKLIVPAEDLARRRSRSH